MDTFLKNKKAVVMIVVLVLGFFAYSVFFGSDPSVESVESPIAESESLVKTAEELSKITFKQDLFASPAYRQLVDFSTILVPQASGRANPFAEIGRD